jgi:hypothetical protein
VYEIVALSARPKPARELGGARSARPSGGIFVNRTEALRFAMFENGNRPQGVLMIPGVFELDMNRVGGAKSQPQRNAGWDRKQPAA